MKEVGGAEELVRLVDDASISVEDGSSVGWSAMVCFLVVVPLRIKEEQGWEPGAKVGGKFEANSNAVFT